MIKLAIIPCTVLLETLFFSKKFRLILRLRSAMQLIHILLLKVSSTQLLYQSCPYQAMTLFFAGPFLDRLLTNQNIFAFKYTAQVHFHVSVLGHLKTCLVLAFGYVLLHDPFSWRNSFGIVIALVGMVLYSYYCTLESWQKATEVLPQTSQANEGESVPLMSARKV
ncbi:UDP-xylose transporter 3 [Camellia lanceoleosa]|uniref:UDP-xylose transporter 3 n=1 Tax=Camellia lanceoleosa TaxID=1840588 RepID=A0ACC0J2F5_9ERIC|nr:UDP-xylose transporter 3 [Camellia lanceoleosa]